MATYRIQRLDGSVAGPLTSSQLKELAAAGRISPADRVAPDGTDRWVPAMRVNGIREILEARAIASADESTESERPQDPIPLQPAEPDRIPAPPASSAMPARPPSIPGIADPPRYGVLRCVAGWITLYGWLIISIGFSFSYFMTVMVARNLLGQDSPWSGGFLAIVVLLCFAAGVATASAVRRFANRADNLTAAFAAVILLPLVPFMIDGIRKGAITPAEGLSLLQTVGTSLSALIAGSIIVAAGEFLVAHADIATNSWQNASRAT
jgi:hypothetical protein